MLTILIFCNETKNANIQFVYTFDIKVAIMNDEAISIPLHHLRRSGYAAIINTADHCINMKMSE